MIYDLSQLIRAANREAHIDMARAMRKKKNGLMTLQIRVNAGNIVDLVELEYVKYEKRRS